MSTPPTLLLADDSLAIQRVVALSFADQSVRVVVAKDGQDAINRMTSDRPDLVLADTNMPCVDGYELARWVRQQPHLTAVPVLLLAGNTDPVDEQRLHDSGANGVLEKPFEPSHVISRVKELLGMKSPSPRATRLVTAADGKPARKTPPATAGLPAEGLETALAPAKPPETGRVSPATGNPFDDILTPATEAPSAPQPSPFKLESASSDADPDPHDDGSPRGDAHDWFGGSPHVPSRVPSLADELGVGGSRFHGPSDVAPVASGRSTSTQADVFESLLAAEQGDPGARAVFQAAAPEVTPEMLDQLADRVVERLRPSVLRDELQRGLGQGLREAVAHTLRESVASETRAAVAEAVQAAVNGTILGTIRGAVNEAVAAAMPAAIEQASARVERAVREVVAQEIREIVHDSAERLVSAEIARIRERR